MPSIAVSTAAASFSNPATGTTSTDGPSRCGPGPSTAVQHRARLTDLAELREKAA